MMQCEEALQLWQQELLGVTVEPTRLEEAHRHIGACDHLCARTLGIPPAVVQASQADALSRQTDLYEALGVSAEEEGDAYAEEWGSLVQQARTGKVDQVMLDCTRALALAAWEAAADYYWDGLRFGETLFLHEGLKRLKLKELPPLFVSEQVEVKVSQATLVQELPFLPMSEQVAVEANPETLAQEDIPTLVLAAEPQGLGQVVVRNSPTGWHTSSEEVNTWLNNRRASAALTSIALPEQESDPLPALDQPHAAGMLGKFALAFWATKTPEHWKLEMLVHAHSSESPWTKLALTLEDEQGQGAPADVLFARRAPHMTGWWAGLRELASGLYHLRLSAHDDNGEPIEDLHLAVHLVGEG